MDQEKLLTPPTTVEVAEVVLALERLGDHQSREVVLRLAHDWDSVREDLKAFHEAQVLQPGKYSVFVIHENGYWEQPTYRTKEPMTEAAFKNKVLQQHHHDFFLAVGVGEDEDCPDERCGDLG